MQLRRPRSRSISTTPAMSCTAISSRCSTDERSFLPIDIYDTEKSRPVAPGQDALGRRGSRSSASLLRCIRTRWPTRRILFRGDRRYARPEAMIWREVEPWTRFFHLKVRLYRTSPCQRRPLSVFAGGFRNSRPPAPTGTIIRSDCRSVVLRNFELKSEIQHPIHRGRICIVRK
jgi:hypothetical protein